MFGRFEENTFLLAIAKGGKIRFCRLKSILAGRSILRIDIALASI